MKFGKWEGYCIGEAIAKMIGFYEGESHEKAIMERLVEIDEIVDEKCLTFSKFQLARKIEDQVMPEIEEARLDAISSRKAAKDSYSAGYDQGKLDGMSIVVSILSEQS